MWISVNILTNDLNKQIPDETHWEKYMRSVDGNTPIDWVGQIKMERLTSGSACS